jgi:PASTA domain
MGSFVPRLLALTVVWLLATAALTYAAAQKIGTAPTAPATVATTTTAAPEVMVVPDVRHQAYVFAKGTLGDNGFGWRVQGGVKGYASNLVVSQTPAPGTRVLDTGAPLVILHLSKAGTQGGVPDDVSSEAPTALKLADVAVAALPAAAAKLPVQKTKKIVAAPKKAVTKQQQPATPPQRWPQNRPPAFTVAGARKEPLDEMPLTVRAKLLLDWLATNPKPTDANVSRWLYQHAWIVAGAKLGWWNGDEALRTLAEADRKVFALWGIGARSEAVARQALAEVEARSH